MTASQPTRIIHLTDLHVTSLADVPLRDRLGKRLLGYRSWRRKRQHQHSWSALANTISTSLAAKPDAVVITGDLLHIGLRAEMRQVRSWLQDLADRVPVLLVPGNHDLYAADSAVAWQQELSDLAVFGEPVAPGVDWPRALYVNDLCIVGLNSAYAAPLTQATGQLGEQQLTALTTLAAELAATGKHCLFAIHHPPDATHCSARKRLLDSAQLLGALNRLKTSTLVHGHLHTNLDYQVENTQVYCTAPASSTGTTQHQPAARLLEFAATGTTSKLL